MFARCDGRCLAVNLFLAEIAINFFHRETFRRVAKWKLRGEKNKTPTVSAVGALFRPISPSSIKPDTLIGIAPVNFRFNFLRRFRFKEPLVLCLARTPLNRGWSNFHVEPPSKRCRNAAKPRANADLGGFPIRSPPDPLTTIRKIVRRTQPRIERFQRRCRSAAPIFNARAPAPSMSKTTLATGQFRGPGIWLWRGTGEPGLDARGDIGARDGLAGFRLGRSLASGAGALP